MSNTDDVKKPHVDRYWHELYIEMQANPFDTRTDVQFCNDIALDVKTFQTWKSKYREYIFREVEHRRKNYRNEMRALGHKALAKKLDKDTNAIKLLFQLLGDLVEKSEQKVEMSHADKIRRLNTIMGETRKREEQWRKASGETTKDGTSESTGPTTP